MAENKKGSGVDIGSYFDSGVTNRPTDASSVTQPKAPAKPSKRMPRSFIIDEGDLESLKILQWKLVMPTFTATANRAFKEFIENHREALEEAKTQLGENGIRELIARKD